VLNGSRVAGLLRLTGAQQEKIPAAQTGEVVGLTRMDEVATGQVLTPSGKGSAVAAAGAPAAGFRPRHRCRKAHRRRQADRGHRVNWSKKTRPSSWIKTPIPRKWCCGTGRHPSADRDGPAAQSPQSDGRRPRRCSSLQRDDHAAGRSSTRASSVRAAGTGSSPTSRSRSRRLPARIGVHLHRQRRGGAIPRNYIPAVEEGVTEALRHGPIGFRSSICGQSDYRPVSMPSTARTRPLDGGQAGDPGKRCRNASRFLLEPIDLVEISVPNAFTARVQRLVSGRRGQILGYDAKPDWPGWDVVSAHMPQSECTI